MVVAVYAIWTTTTTTSPTKKDYSIDCGGNVLVYIRMAWIVIAPNQYRIGMQIIHTNTHLYACLCIQQITSNPVRENINKYNIEKPSHKRHTGRQAGIRWKTFHRSIVPYSIPTRVQNVFTTPHTPSMYPLYKRIYIFTVQPDTLPDYMFKHTNKIWTVLASLALYETKIIRYTRANRYTSTIRVSIVVTYFQRFSIIHEAPSPFVWPYGLEIGKAQYFHAEYSQIRKCASWCLSVCVWHERHWHTPSIWRLRTQTNRRNSWLFATLVRLFHTPSEFRIHSILSTFGVNARATYQYTRIAPVSSFIPESPTSNWGVTIFQWVNALGRSTKSFSR